MAWGIGVEVLLERLARRLRNLDELLHFGKRHIVIAGIRVDERGVRNRSAFDAAERRRYSPRRLAQRLPT